MEKKALFCKVTLFWCHFISMLFDMAGMLLVCGGLVNGPYSLITTAVSADLVSVCVCVCVGNALA